MNKLLKEMQKYAKKNDVPIIFEDGIKEIEKIIIKNEVKSILEIGSAIGYSAIKMHLVKNCYVTTIERDPIMYQEAIKNVNLAKLEDYITVIKADALEVEIEDFTSYDMLYIDAAKAQYQKFFEKFEPLIKPGGVFVFDNLKFHGMVDLEPSEIKNRNTRQLVGKLKRFNEYIENHPDFEFEYIDQGDGIGIAYRKGRK